MGKYKSVGNVKIDYNRKSKGLGTYLSVIYQYFKYYLTFHSVNVVWGIIYLPIYLLYSLAL